MTKIGREKCYTIFIILCAFIICFIVTVVFFEPRLDTLKFLGLTNNETYAWFYDLRNSTHQKRPSNGLVARVSRFVSRQKVKPSPSNRQTVLPPSYSSTDGTKSRIISQLPFCDTTGKIVYNYAENVTKSEVLNQTAIDFVQEGGRYEPKNCRPKDYVAIIVTYRNRSQHRDILLNHLHNFLQQQMIKYDIYLIEPVLPIIFNRGLLCNIGFKESIARGNYSCIIFHDVDQLPLNSENHYICDINARHLASESSKNKYKLPYYAYTGGVIAIQRDFFMQLNGFSNVFFGWGGEDDDLLMRIQILNKRSGILRPAKGVGRYLALPHKRDELNPENPLKGKLYKTSKTRFREEGLKSLKYKVLSVKSERLYTWVQVYYNQTQIMQEYEVKWGIKPA